MEEKFEVPELMFEDLHGVELDAEGDFRVDYLVAVSKRAMNKLDHEEHMRKKKDKGKRNLCDLDYLHEQHPRKKKMVEEEGNREKLERPRFSRGVCTNEFSERALSREPRLSNGVCIKEQRETVIRRSDERKLSGEEILVRRETSKKITVLVDRTATASDEYQELKKMKESNKIIKKNSSETDPKTPAELPREFMETLQKHAEGKCIQELHLVIQKTLFATDISKVHNRMSMPSRHLLHEFLTKDELAELKLRNEKNVNAIEADIIEPSLQRGKVSLRRWEMKKTSGNSSISYVFSGSWNRIVASNKLHPGHVVQVWSVRVEGRLWFLLVRIPKGEKNDPTSEPRLSLSS